MERGDTLALVKRHIAKDGNLKHMIAVGAIMKELAMRLGEDEVIWEMVGILHDIDFEKCSGLEDHTLKAKEILKGHVSDGIIEIIMAHNYENTGVIPDTKIRKALIASDAVSGLIVASALVMPSRKLEEVRAESLMKKFKTKEFAKGCDRGKIAVCAEIGYRTEEFMPIALEGMKKVAAELGL